MSAPLLIWAGHFLVIYALTAIACARSFGVGVVSSGIAAATLIATGAALFTIRAALSQRRREAGDMAAFVRWMSAAAGGLALVAILWEALPVLIVPACG